MSINRIRHPGLAPADIDLGPAHAGHASHYGEIVRGGPGPAETQRIAQRLHAQREKVKAREVQT